MVLSLLAVAVIALAVLFWRRREQKSRKLTQEYNAASELNWVYAPSQPAIDPGTPTESADMSQYDMDATPTSSKW